MGTKRKAEAPAEGVRRSGRIQSAKAQKIAEDEPAVTVVEAPVTEKAGQADAVITPLVVATKPEPFRHPRQRKKCGFLKKLPGEIRNRIYRYVLPENLDVTPKGPGEPALLRVSKLIRSESRSIYYAETEFRKSTTGTKNSPSNITMSMRGDANWDNLLAWIKANHDGLNLKPTPAAAGEDLYHLHRFSDACFTLVEHIPSWLPWAKVEGALNALRKSHQGMPTPWAEDFDEDYWG